MIIFNAAVHSSLDMPDHAERFVSLQAKYRETDERIEVLVTKLQISRLSCYNRSEAIAQMGLSLRTATGKYAPPSRARLERHCRLNDSRR